MTCPKCNSENVNVQAVAIQKKKRRGVVYWVFFGWLIDILLWIFLTLPRLLIAMFGHKRTKTVVKSIAVCQNCGNKWNV
jgi:transcription elongation factor Elf1